VVLVLGPLYLWNLALAIWVFLVGYHLVIDIGICFFLIGYHWVICSDIMWNLAFCIFGLWLWQFGFFSLAIIWSLALVFGFFSLGIIGSFV
jgi:hypothetical protein